MTSYRTKQTVLVSLPLLIPALIAVAWGAWVAHDVDLSTAAALLTSTSAIFVLVVYVAAESWPEFWRARRARKSKSRCQLIASALHHTNMGGR